MENILKIYKNVLSVETLDQIKRETIEKFHQQCWSPSSLFWEKNLLEGIQGDCLSTMASDDLHKNIIDEIKHILPKCSKTIVQHYVWAKNSGIAVHNDGGFFFGATIYMNASWDINHGGIFLWKESEGSEYKVILPEFNTLVLNDEQQNHIVTPVSAYCNEPRITIQIWGVV
jgi:hypothetical protein